MKRTYWISCICLVFMLTSIADAQYSGRQVSVYSTMYLQTWRLKEGDTQRRLTQFALPLFVRYPISRRVNLLIQEANAISTISLSGESPNPDIDDQSFSGIGDTKVKLSYALVPDKLLLTGGLSLPTGKSRLDQDEARAFRQFYSETLGFRVNRLGEGFGGNIGLVGVQTVGSITLGFGASYFAKGGYEPLDSDEPPSYNPGDQFSGAVGVDWQVGRFHLRNGVILTAYTADQLDESDQFRQGVETVVEDSIGYRTARLSTTLYVRNTFRQRNETVDATGQLITDPETETGHRLVIALSTDYRLNRRATLRGVIENQRRLRAGKADVWSIGGGFRSSLTDSLVGEVGLRFSVGQMRDDTIDLQGVAVSGALISTF